MKTSHKSAARVLLVTLFLGLCISCDGTRSGQKDDEEEQAASLTRKSEEVELGDGMTRRVVDVVDSRTGKTTMRHGRITRNGERVLFFATIFDKTGTIISSDRFFEHGERTILQEHETNGNELMFFFGDDERTPIEVFERLKDGSVVPFGKTRLDEFKEKWKGMNEIIGDDVRERVKELGKQ